MNYDEINTNADRLREAQAAYAAIPPEGYTIDDYLALPDDLRAELIDGKFFFMEAPTVNHQELALSLAIELRSFIQKKKGKCRVCISPIDVQLDRDNKTMVQPDVIIVCDKDKITEKRIYGAPDFCLEVLSPYTRKHDMVTKLHKYKNAGVHEYWIIDEKRRQVLCYYFKKNTEPDVYTFDTPIPVQTFSGTCQIDMLSIEKNLI